MMWVPFAVAVLAPMIFCFVRGAVDIWEKRYVWGGLGILSGLLIFLLGIPV